MLRFGHGKAAADFASGQGQQEPFLLCGGGLPFQDFHVAGVRGLAVEGGMGEGALTKSLADMGELRQG